MCVYIASGMFGSVTALVSFCSHFYMPNILYSNCLYKHIYIDYRLLLGEYQFSFVCFLIGQCFDAFEHWKKLTALLCSCDDAVFKYGDLYFDFIGKLVGTNSGVNSNSI